MRRTGLFNGLLGILLLMAPGMGGAGEFGEVNFPIGCDPRSQSAFNEAVAILHSFWYEEAHRRFEALADEDAECAMARWGIAMSLWHPLWRPPAAEALARGSAAVEEARRIPVATQRERDYIDAIGAYYDDYATLSPRERALKYEQAMAQLHQRYPNDLEAAVFYALAMIANQPHGDKRYSKTLQAADLLEPLFREAPDHPGIAHYLIHALDYPRLAERALPAARRYAEIAPAVSHALHMPSHIFSQLGMWEESIASNIASAQAARHHDSLFDLAHALEWQAYAQLQTCRDTGAAEAMQEMVSKARPGNFAVEYSAAAIPARVALERRDWSAAVALTSPQSGFPLARAAALFGRAVGAAHLGDTALLRQSAAQLDALAEPAEQVSGAGRWLADIKVQALVARALLAELLGDGAAALALMREAATLEEASYMPGPGPAPLLPARELLAELLARQGQRDAAIAAQRALRTQFAGRLNSFRGEARAALGSGDEAAAEQVYRQILDQCAGGAPDHPARVEAAAFLERR